MDNEKENNTHSAGSQSALKMIKVFPKDYEKLRSTRIILVREFYKQAKAHGITIRKGKQYRNLPRFAEAVEYSQLGLPISEYINILIQRAQGIHNQIREMQV